MGGVVEFLLGGGIVGSVLLFLFKILVERSIKRADQKKALADAEAAKKADEAARIAAAEKEALEKERKEHDEYLRKEFILMERHRHALGRYLYWLCKGAERHEAKEKTEYWNGDLSDAKRAYEKAEAEMKELQRDMLSRIRD